MTLLLVPFHLDEALDGFAVSALDAGRIIRVPLPEAGPWQRMAALYAEVASAVTHAAGVPVVASGDCTTSLGCLAGLQGKGLDPAIVWFDAHGDFNTDETTPSGYLGGMPLAIAVGRGDQTAPRALGLRPIEEQRAILVDARDLDPAEREALDRSAVRRVPVSALDPEAQLDPRILPPGPIYLHLDLDVLDPPELPGLRFPSPGGVRRAELARAVAAVIATGRVAAIGLACTWWPDRVDSAAAGSIVQQLLEVQE
ncbi:MAG TPA: arginase family protein [Kofleriaceae bacterium]|nr:arginase family protein [Kofleriaceae bacterium]